MPCWEKKKYVLDKSENFDAYMKELGVGLVLRKMGNTVTPTVELQTEDNYKYKLITKSTFKCSTIEFVLGEEFDEETLDGRKVKSVITMECDEKLVHEQKGEKPTTIIREFSDDCLVATMTCNDVTCIRTYKAAEC